MRHPRTRTILAVTLIATAICADRSAVLAGQRAQAQRVEAADTAGGFARRLTVSLRQSVPAVKLHQGRIDHVAPVSLRPGPLVAQSIGHAREGTPFHFRLPPPLL